MVALSSKLNGQEVFGRRPFLHLPMVTTFSWCQAMLLTPRRVSAPHLDRVLPASFALGELRTTATARALFGEPGAHWARIAPRSTYRGAQSGVYRVAPRGEVNAARARISREIPELAAFLRRNKPK